MDMVHTFSGHDKTNIIESYFSTKSMVLTERVFRKEFPGRKIPCRKTNIVKTFWKTGNMRNDNKGNSGRQVTVRTPANVQAVREYFQQSPRKSTIRLSQKVGISRAIVEKIIHTDLNLFPYEMQILQKQTDANKRERVKFCQMISEIIENQGVLGLI